MLEEKVDQLTEVTSELATRLLKDKEGGPAPEGDKADTHGTDDADK